jgi:hypothetical protein
MTGKKKLTTETRRTRSHEKAFYPEKTPSELRVLRASVVKKRGVLNKG